MDQDVGEILGVDRVQDVEEVLPRRAFVLGILIGEVRHHLGVLRELRIKVLDRELIVVRDLDGAHLLLLEQVLLAPEDGLEEVLVDDGLVRQVELEAI